MKRIISLALTLAMLHTLSPNILPAAAANTFPDVTADHWAYPYVSMLTANGSIDGYPDGTFAPSRNIKVCEFIKVLVISVLGEPPAVADTQHWAQAYMDAAADKGIIEVGAFPRDSWERNITRQEMATAITRAMTNVLKESEESSTDALTANIKDWGATCESCKPQIAQAYAKGIILGIDGSFYGTREATRAEAATMIVRLIDKEYRYTWYDGVPFCAKTDVTDTGLMKITAAERWIYKTLEGLRFYREGGKYYFSVTLPEVPEGFEMRFSVDMDPGIGYETNAYLQSRDIPRTGTITRELPANFMTQVFQRGDIQIGIGVIEKPIQPLQVKWDGRANILAIYSDGKLEEFYSSLGTTNGEYVVRTATDMKLKYSDYFEF